MPVSKEEVSALRALNDIQSTDFVFVFVGALFGVKGLNELVRVFEKLAVANIKLLLLGSYEQKLDLLTKATRAAIKDHLDIVTTGFQKDVRPYFALSSVLVFLSYRKGFPNLVLQATSIDLLSTVIDINGCN
jgi:glycosyltransferase involved in cell wall biosynthesis